MFVFKAFLHSRFESPSFPDKEPIRRANTGGLAWIEKTMRICSPRKVFYIVIKSSHGGGTMKIIFINKSANSRGWSADNL